ncbi:IclR family transcriptional regulator [Marinomonas gallaica]|uniref:IclR family transcriptional regulator n=1 Tax=Marinomonas gallaica TaxID=1806667 RepID=UPI003CE58976
MSSLNKMLNVLNIFGPGSLVINVDDIAKQLSLSRATAYRYVRELCDAGLLTRIDTSYTLGARIIELDWMMRQHDPLISHGREVMAELSKSTGLTVYMSVFYDGHIINTHIESDIQKYGFAFGRGRPLPIFKGAQSKVLVANQKPSRLKKIFDEQIEPDEDHLITWKEFNSEAKRIRKDGYCITHDELNFGLTGIAAPIFNLENDEILGSIAFVGATSSFELFRLDAVVERLKMATAKIEKGAQSDNT